MGEWILGFCAGAGLLALAVIVACAWWDGAYPFGDEDGDDL